MSTFARLSLPHSSCLPATRYLVERLCINGPSSSRALSLSCSLVRPGIPSTQTSRCRLLSSSAKPTYTSNPLNVGKISAHDLRHYWTRAEKRRQEAEQVTVDAPIIEKLEEPRFSFYSSFSGSFVYTNTLEELSSQEPVVDSFFKRKIDLPASTKIYPDKPSYWLDVLQPTPEEILQLCARLGVHSLTIEDILTGERQEKLEVHPGYRFLSYRSFNADAQSANYLDNVNVYILSFPHATLSLRSGSFPNYSRIPKRLEERFEDAKSRSVDWILFEIIDAITDGFTLAIKPMQANIEQLSESLIGGSRNSAALLRTIAITRKRVLALRRLLGNKSEIMKALVKRYSLNTESEIGLNFSDVEDHLIAISSDLDHWEETLAQSENSCLIQLNLQTSQAQNESSEAISKLTILSTVILPLNVITGLWGMNVMVPGQGEESLFWFGSLASMMVIVASSGYMLATRFMRNHRASKRH